MTMYIINRITNTTSTRSLRDFHNLYVKKKLINSVSIRGNTLIDLAVGKGGDMSKWIDAIKICIWYRYIA